LTPIKVVGDPMFAFRLKQVPAPMDGLPARERAIATAAVLINVCMANLDSAIANTALPTIARELDVTEAQSIWIVSAYQLAMVGSLLPSAALGEIIGFRRVSMCGLVVFTIASLICGIAPTFEWLLAGRVAQGIAASGILGIGLAMMRFIFPLNLLGRGMGINALAVGFSLAAGPSLASIILSFCSWHWLFLINVPVGLIGIAMGLYAMPASPRSLRRFDLPAAVLCAAFLASAVFALTEAAQAGSGLSILVAAIVSLMSLAVLVRSQSFHPAPILPIDLLYKPVFALSVAVGFLASFTQALAFVSLPFLFQILFGYSQVETGFLLTPWPLLVALAAPWAGRLADRKSAGLLGGIGLAIMSVGMFSLAMLPPGPTAFDISWRMALCGLGFGFFQSPNMRVLILSASPERSGGAGGLSNVANMLGQACGAAMVAALFKWAGAQGAMYALTLGAIAILLGSSISVLRLRYPAESR
jgi:DHA2 family multidrug resistance protein-like MFS transporter